MSVPHPDPDRLALAALPAEPRDPEVAAHLSDCDLCREHVGALRRTVDLARTGRADAAAPPPRVWQAIAAELGELGELDQPGTGADPAPLVDHRPAPETPPANGSRFRSRWRAAALPIATAVAGIAAGLGIGLLAAPTPAAPAAPSVTLLARLQPLGGADPAAGGTVDEVSRPGARELVIRVQGVTDTAGGDYLEAWLLDPAGTRLVSLGALTPTGPGGAYQGVFTVPADLPMSAFSIVDVSAERWDGDPTHSRISLVRGSMA